MKSFIIITQSISAIIIILLILLQNGKGANIGATFGNNVTNSLFGASGSANFLSRTTAIFAIIFFISTLSLTYFNTYSQNSSTGILGYHNNLSSNSSSYKNTLKKSVEK